MSNTSISSCERKASVMNQTNSSTSDLPSQIRPQLSQLTKKYSYQAPIEAECLEFLPATTYQPPSPRGRLIAHQYVRPSLRLDHHAIPSPEEVMAATRSRRSGSTSSTSSNETISSASSIKSGRRRGCFFDLDKLPEAREFDS